MSFTLVSLGLFAVSNCSCRLYLSPYETTPTYRNVHNKFSVSYLLNLVLVDEEDRRYFKQQEIVLYRLADSAQVRVMVVSVVKKSVSLALGRGFMSRHGQMLTSLCAVICLQTCRSRPYATLDSIPTLSMTGSTGCKLAGTRRCACSLNDASQARPQKGAPPPSLDGPAPSQTTIGAAPLDAA